MLGKNLASLSIVCKETKNACPQALAVLVLHHVSIIYKMHATSLCSSFTMPFDNGQPYASVPSSSAYLDARSRLSPPFRGSSASSLNEKSLGTATSSISNKVHSELQCVHYSKQSHASFLSQRTRPFGASIFLQIIQNPMMNSTTPTLEGIVTLTWIFRFAILAQLRTLDA